MQGIIFKLNKQNYALNIENISEVIEVPKITSIPNARQDIKGVINHRGDIISIYELMPTNITKESKIIILQPNEETPSKIGILTDHASETLQLNEDKLQSPIDQNEDIGILKVQGITNKNKEIIVVLKL